MANKKKLAPRVLVCPMCGRTLETRVNRFGVETWPYHMHAARSDGSWKYNQNIGREPGRRDNEVPCSNSGEPID